MDEKPEVRPVTFEEGVGWPSLSNSFGYAWSGPWTPLGHSDDVEPLTDDELAEIEARANAATDGPWEWSDAIWRSSGPVDQPDYDTDELESEVLANVGASVVVVREWANHAEASGLSVRARDQAFIAHSREDVPRLIAEVRRLRRALGEDFHAWDARRAGTDSSAPR